MTHKYVVQFDTIYEYTWNLEQNIFPRNNPIVTFLQGQSRMGITNLFQFIIFEQEFNYTTWTRPCLGNLFFLWPDSPEPCAAACHSVAGRISWPQRPLISTNRESNREKKRESKSEEKNNLKEEKVLSNANMHTYWWKSMQTCTPTDVNQSRKYLTDITDAFLLNLSKPDSRQGLCRDPN